MATWGTSYYTDYSGERHRRKQCSIPGCEHLRQLLRRYKPDKTKYHLEHRVCCHHKVDGSPTRHAYQDKQRQNHWRQMGIILSTEEYDQILNLQDGKCAVCGLHSNKLNQRLCVDHDHDTGIIRGLICKTCNAMIAWFEKVSSFDAIKDFLETNVFEKFEDTLIQTPELREVRRNKA